MYLVYSYFNRIVDSCNRLPRDIRDETRVTSFKSKVKDFLMKWYCKLGLGKDLI